MDMFSSPLFYEIRLLVANLSRKNYRPTFTELSQLIQLYGEDAFVFLLTCLVEETDSLSQHDQKDGHKLVLLSQQLTEAATKPNFTSMLCRAFGAASGRDDTTIALGGSYAMSIGAECSGKVSQELLQSLCRSLKLNVHQQLALAVGLAQAPQANLAQEGHKFLRSAIQELSAVGNDKLTVHTLHALLSVLRGNEEYMSNPKASSSLIQAVRASHADSSAALPLLPLMDEENSDASDYGPGDLPAKLLLPSEAGQLVDQLNKSSMIADYVRDLGYGCTSTVEAFRVAIRESGVPMDERQAAGLLCLVAVYHAGLATEMSSIVCADVLGRAGVNAAMGLAVGAVLDGPMDGGLVLNGVGGEGMSTWGLDVMAQVLRTDYPHLDWQMVALQLDQPGLFLSDSRALRNLVSLYRAASGAVVFPVTVLLRPWENRVGQLSFIHQAIAAPPDVISFEPAGGLVQMQASFELEAPEVPSGPPNKAWLSIDLISTLLSFSETPLWYSARTLFDLPLRFCPELLVCGLACVEPTWNKLRAELLALLTPAYFRPGRSPHMAAVVKRVHTTNPQLLVDALVEMYRQEESVAVVRDTLNLMLLVPSTQQDVLSSTHSDFVVALAAAAADKDQLNLEKFLVDKLGSVQDKEGFARGILNFVQKHGGGAKSKSAPGEPALLSLESLAVLLRVLQGDQSILLSPTLNTEVRAVVEAVAKRFPEVVGGIQSPVGAVGVQASGPPVGPSVHGGSATPAEVIEEMANAYFQKIYTAEQSIGEVIEMLKRFKTSKDQREQEIFSCMIRNLFDEYRFFHKYPEKELRITGILFGTLIQHQLVSSLTLGVALRYVLEALRRAPDTGNTGKWFRFGMFALEQFKGRLHEWPQYCSHIVQIPHLRNGYPELVAEIERAMTRHQPQALPLEQQLLQLPQQHSPLVLPQAASTELNGLPPPLQGSLQSGPSAQLSLNQQHHFHHAVQPPPQVKPSPQLPIGGLRTTGTAGGSPYTAGLGGSDALPSSLITGSGGLEQSGLAAFLGIDGRRVGGASQSPASPPQHALARPTGLLDQRSPPQVPASPNLGATAATGNHIGERDVLAAIQSPVLAATAMSPQLTAGGQQVPGSALQQALSSALPDLLSAAPSAAQPVPITVSVPQVPPLPQAAPLSESDLAACIDRIMAGVPESSALASPPEQVADRINFVINNVSMGNLDNKAAELKDALKEEYVPWLAHYLVQKRISTQANLHGMYLSFIDRLESAALSQAVLQHVLQYVSKLLRSNKIITNTGDRSILKNLGSFLGQLTIARNRPLLHRQLDLKELLYHGYETGRLFALTPFVAKILECAEKSKVFRPPNPWVMGLMSVLAELYQVDELKINIKFEIDLLCKRLDLKIADVARPDTLRQRLQPRKEKNPDFNLKLLGVGGAGVMMSPPQLPGVGPDVPQAEDDLGSSGAAAAAAAADSATPSLQPQPQGSPQQQPSQAAGVAGLAPATKEDGGISDQTVIPNLAAYVIINPQLGIFNQSPPLRRVVPLAVDRAIREIIQPVVERSVTIACITTKELIIKDLAMEPDENKMRKAAHLMVSSLAGSLALVTCKEPLRVSIGNHLRTLLSQSNVGDTAVVDQVVQVCSADNLELGCMLIEKAATEKAIADIDEALAPAVHYRRKHREQTGQPFYDMSVFANNRFPGALPEPLRPKPGGLVQSQLEVYEAFARLPRGVTGVRGPAGAQEKKAEGGPLTGAGLTLQQALEAFEALVVRLEQTLHNLALAAAAAGREVTLAMLPAEHEVTTAMREIVLLPQKVQAQSRDELVGRELTTIFKSLYDGQPNEVLLLRLEVLVAILEGLNIKRVDLLTWINYVHVTEGNQKLHRVVLLLLLRSKLVKATDIDLYLAKNMDAGRNAFWIEFAINLVRQVVLERLAPYTELPQTLDILQKSANRQQMLIRKEIHRLVEDIRLVMAKDVLEAQKKQQQTQQLVSQAQQLGVPPGQLGGLTGQQQTPPQAQPQAPPTPPQLALAQAQAQALQGAGIKMGAGVAAPRGADASGMPAMGAQQAQRPPQDRDRQDVTCLLEHWIVLWNESPGSEKAYLKYFSMLQQYDVTKSPDAIEKFIRIATDVCVEACLKNAVVNDNDEMHRTTLSYTIVDAYAKLLYLLVKYNGDVNSRINILQRILKAVVSSLREDPLRTPLDPRPYFRLLVDLLHDFNAFDPTLDANNIAVLTAFAIAFNNLQPSIVPAFAFAWLELISHRMFMPALLLAKGQKGWILMHRLLMDLFTFLEPFLRKAELNDPIRILYKGTLRVLLVLLHDFPEFLCDYHVSFCDVIPPTCIQLRNLILSAFPRNMRLPDPFTPNLKVDLLPEILQPPRIPAGYTGALMSLKQEVDAYLKTRQPASLLAELPRKLRINASDGQGYNVSAMNALVIYVGTQAISQFQSKGQGAANGPVAGGAMPGPIAHSAPMDIFQSLIKSLDPEGRYLLLNAIANQLRYPNNQTHYFSCVLLYLFAEANSELVKEQITRVLLERLIVHRPHPWGLLITFIELIKNPRYNFWQHSFVHCAQEIERVFDSVARSCMGSQSLALNNNSGSSGGRAPTDESAASAGP